MIVNHHRFFSERVVVDKASEHPYSRLMADKEEENGFVVEYDSLVRVINDAQERVERLLQFRTARMLELNAAGMTAKDLGNRFDVTEARVYQLLRAGKLARTGHSHKGGPMYNFDENGEPVRIVDIDGDEDGTWITETLL